jgi:hypothetical protein
MGSIQIQNLRGLFIIINKTLEVERVKGIEPSLSAWEAEVLPLNYTRNLTEHEFKHGIFYKIY